MSNHSALSVAIEKWQEENPLRAWRKASQRDYSIRVVAQMLGVSFNSVMNWEQGHYPPRPVNFAKLTLLTGNEEMTQH